MKKMTIIMLIFPLFAGCSKEPGEGFVIDTSLEISVSDVNGKDLLDQANPKSFDGDEIKLFYLRDGKTAEFYEKNLDYPKGYFIAQYKDGYRIKIMLNDASSEQYPITYIRWNKDRTDTIKSEIHRTSNSIVCTKVWLNDEIKWNAYDSARYIQLSIP